jgi:hypothetical protein
LVLAWLKLVVVKEFCCGKKNGFCLSGMGCGQENRFRHDCGISCVNKVGFSIAEKVKGCFPCRLNGLSKLVFYMDGIGQEELVSCSSDYSTMWLAIK